jgi:CHAT domain-containing protein
MRSPSSRPRRAVCRLVPVSLSLAISLGMACRADRPPPPGATAPIASSPAAPALAPQDPPLFTRGDLGRSRPLAPGARQRYRLDLTAGSFLHVEIEQRGVDVYAQLLDPAGATLIDVDSPTGAQGSEHLYWVTRAAGPYTLLVCALPDGHPPAEPGRYLARIAAERPARAEDRRRAAAEKAFADAYALVQASPAGTPPPAAVTGFETARALWERLGDRRRQADALTELAYLYRQAGKVRDAIAAWRRVIPLLSAPEDRRHRGIALNELGLALRDVGDTAGEEQALSAALALARELGARHDEAAALTNLGRLQGRLGQPFAALDLLARAATLWRQLADRRELVKALNITGEVYVTLGELELALDRHLEALELLDPRSEPLARATTLSFIGRARLAAGDLDGASEAYSEVLALAEGAHDSAATATAWTGLGLVEERRGNPRRALELYRSALSVFADRGPLLDRAIVVNNLAWLYNRLGEGEQALDLHRQALELFRRLQDHEGVATSLLGLAQAERRLGHADLALADAEAALAKILEVLDSGRTPVPLDDLRVPYRASRQAYFDLFIDLLMELHRRHPDAGYDALALAVSEQERARNLLEILADKAVSSGQATDPALLVRQRSLQAAIDAADLDLRRLRSADPPRAPAAAEARQRRRLAEFARVQARVRRRNPWQASLHGPRPAVLEQIRDQLDAETTLLEFHLGDDHSVLFVVTPDRLESHLLPSRAEIGKLARRAYDLLVDSDRVTHRVPAAMAMGELSRALLGPVAGELGGRRLLVVAGGPLEYIPFAALPLPDRPHRLLLEEFEVVHVPSVSVLAALRRQAAARAPPGGLLALLADPVLSADDERLAGERPVAPASPTDPSPPLHRLTYARREAADILALARGRGTVLSAQGFDANRELVLGGRLAGYRILHFATHGVLRADHSELSALILSRYHPDGTPSEGRLSLYDVYDLRLPADLVVLSACRTALGKQVRGEGVLGLPRGFLYAGATRVLVSLWDVQDESTAELMRRFYRHLLVDGLSPAAALRAAQLSMLAEPRFAPYHWAGFVLQGDWR